LGEPSKPDLGIFYEMLQDIAPKEQSLSFLSKDWPDVNEWRKQARKKVLELMNFFPQDTLLNSSVDFSQSKDGLVFEEISYDMPYGPRTHGFFMYPEGAKKRKLPAIVALHDHGGFFYYGKEKIVEDTRIKSKALDEHKLQSYGGRSWATEIAKQGYAVLAVDVFLWGSRKIPVESVNEQMVANFEGLEHGSDDYIRSFNFLWDSVESSIMVSSLLNAGASWPGIFAYEDMRSVDYLLTRPEIDPERIACGGLSGGGLRTILLAGLDPRIKAAFCVAFMSTLGGMLRNHIRGNGLIMYVPYLLQFLDLPDLIALRAPSPLFAQFDREDGLFSLEGMKEADRKMAKIYEKMRRPENYIGKFYPGRHKFDVEMQEDVFSWIKEKL
jgi:dienelactone hydrolase